MRPSFPTGPLQGLPFTPTPIENICWCNETKATQFHSSSAPRVKFSSIFFLWIFFVVSETEHLGRALSVRSGDAGGAYGEWLMVTSEVFIRHAAECEYMGKRSRDRKDKELWRRMAERWIRCAELAELHSQPSARTRAHGKPTHA